MHRLQKLTKWGRKNCAPKVITNYLDAKYAGGRALSSDVVDSIISDLKSGNFTYRVQIARKNGVSNTSVGNYMNKLGVKFVKKPPL